MPSWPRVLVLILVALACPDGAGAAGLDGMQSSEIEALQHRLTDAGCYSGAIDGQPTSSTVAAVAACPSQVPVLRIETETHTTTIEDIAVDARCDLMATGAEDKTVRLWAMPEGRLLRTVRLPIDIASGGSVHAVTLSADGRTLAVGGYDAGYEAGVGIAIYVVDLIGDRVRRLGHFENVVDSLALSPDGRLIAVGLAGHNGIRVIGLDDGRELMADREYGDAVYGLAFAPDGSLLATSWDGGLRLYGANLKLKGRIRATGGAKPYQLALDPAGRRVAIGYEDTSAVTVLDAATLRPAMRTSTTDITTGNLHSVAWTDGGRQLIAGGRADARSGDSAGLIIRRFAPSGQSLGDSLVSRNTITVMQPCAGSVAFATARPGLGLFGVDGRSRELSHAVTPDMRMKFDAGFTLSADATTVRFGLGPSDADPVLFDLSQGTLIDSPTPVASLASPVQVGLPVTDWDGDSTPKLGGVPLKFRAIDHARSLAIEPSHAGFVLGSNYQLTSFDAEGKPRWSKPVPGIAWGVDIPPDGRVVVAAYADGTLRWHRLSDGQEVLALFVDAATKQWVAWTPKGYYMASPSGEDLIGWHVNRGWEQLADFFPASRFRDKFNRPDIVRLVLGTLDEDEAQRQADAVAKRRDDTKPLIERLPPIISILSPVDGAGVAPGTVEIRYGLRSPSGAPVDRVEALVDGARIGTRGLGRPSETQGTISLPMPPHDATIALVAYAAGRASEPVRLKLRAVGSAAEPADASPQKPKLFALLVGVSHYADADLDLGFAAEDARDLAATLKAQSGGLYADVEVKLLTDDGATSTAVKDGLLWLQGLATARDVELLFVAGHGLTDAKGKFWFMTHDADPARVLSTAVSQDDITSILYDLPGKKLMLLDACHSGSALDAGARASSSSGPDVSAAISDFAQAEGGVVAYAASTGKEYSFES